MKRAPRKARQEFDAQAFLNSPGVASRVADYAAPRRMYLVDEFPRNATGKVLKRELQHHPALQSG